MICKEFEKNAQKAHWSREATRELFSRNSIEISLPRTNPASASFPVKFRLHSISQPKLPEIQLKKLAIGAN